MFRWLIDIWPRDEGGTRCQIRRIDRNTLAQMSGEQASQKQPTGQNIRNSKETSADIHDPECNSPW
jgi:hypothetical protein